MRSKQSTIAFGERIFLTITIAGLLTFAGNPSVQGGGVVGTGTPGSCTEGPLNSALAGGGLVTFNCGPAPHTLLISSRKTIAENTEIRGGGLITISGGNAISHFQVFNGKSLLLRDLTLSGGRGPGGAIENFGALQLTAVTLTDNTATTTGGAIQNYGTVSIEKSLISGNLAPQSGGGIHNDTGQVTIITSRLADNRAQNATGGGVWSNGTLTVKDTVFSGNRAAGNGGGGIFNNGFLALTDVTFENNIALYAGPANGGGLNHNGGTATLSRITFRGNSSNSYGGGLFIGNAGTLIAVEAIFTGNQSVVGGAVSNSGTFSLARAVVFGNSAGSAGGVANGMAGFPSVNAASLINVTVEGNTAGASQAGGVRSDNGLLELQFATIVGNSGGGVGRGAAASHLSLKNTILADNLPGNCVQSVTSNGFNLSSDFSCLITQSGDQVDTDPQLGPLATNGGWSLNRLPLNGSPAINAGQCQPGVTTDQRGAARPVGETCDIGAVEAGGVLPRGHLPLIVR